MKPPKVAGIALEAASKAKWLPVHAPTTRTELFGAAEPNTLMGPLGAGSACVACTQRGSIRLTGTILPGESQANAGGRAGCVVPEGETRSGEIAHAGRPRDCGDRAGERVGGG